MPLPKPSQLTKKGVQRFATYAIAAAVFAGLIIATLVTFGLMTEEQFEGWVVMVGVTVPALVGLVTTILALFNVEKAPDQQREHTSDTNQV